MTDHKIDPSLIEKINKLLNMNAEKGCTEEEAATAMNMAQKLLARHNLTMACLEQAGGGPSDDRKTKIIRGKNQYFYQECLMGMVCDVNFCFLAKQHYQEGRKKVKVWFVVGTEMNSTVALNMYEYLNQAINRLAHENGYAPPKNLSKSALSFKEGVSYRLQVRLHDQMKADNQMSDQASGDEFALVVVGDLRQDEIDLSRDHLFGLEPGTTKKARAMMETDQHPKNKGKSRFDKMDMEAFWKGSEKGRDVSLEQQING